MRRKELTLEDVLFYHEKYGMTLQISNGKVIKVDFPKEREKGE